jgi:DNA-binding NarL/FixJ family response regulator
MNHAMEELARDEERLARLSSAFQHGVVLVDGNGAIVWMDRAARRRVNGELRNLVLPLARSEPDSVDCFVSPVDLKINGECVTVGVIQEVEKKKQSPDLMAAIESVLADSTSWFTRTVMEKLRTVSQSKAAEPSVTPASNGASRLDSLSAREREVLGLICEGQSDAQMAILLGLSENTVRNHIAALYRKIGVNRRSTAVIWAHERGITGRDSTGSGRGARRPGNGHGTTLSY